jgi:hypothetical protein
MLIMMLSIVPLMLINPTASVAESSCSQLCPASAADVLRTRASVKNWIAATKFAKQSISPFVNTVIPGQRLLRMVLMKSLLVSPSCRWCRWMWSGCRSGTNFHSVPSATSKNDRLVSFTFFFMKHLASALTIRFLWERIIQIVFA